MSKVLNLILNHVLESRCYIIMHYQNFACVLNLNFIHKHCESFLHVKTHLLREDGGMVLFSFFECETFVFISNFFFAVCQFGFCCVDCWFVYVCGVGRRWHLRQISTIYNWFQFRTKIIVSWKERAMKLKANWYQGGVKGRAFCNVYKPKSIVNDQDVHFSHQKSLAKRWPNWIDGINGGKIFF